MACDVPPEGYNLICAYAAAFKAGMRLPFRDLHAAVLRHYDLAPSQLMPNAWRYLNAFVLLCETAGVQPMLPVFLFFFALCAEKESMGRYHFRPRHSPLPLSPPDSGHCRLFTGKMPHSPWKHKFFFIQGPSWPCSLKWGTPSKASVKEPVLTADTPVTDAIAKLAHLAGHTGIDILKFLSVRNPPVGHLQIPAAATPQRLAVKQEASAAAVAGTTEQTRKRKSPDPITSLPPSSLQIGTGYDDRFMESLPAPVGHGEPSVAVNGGESSCFQKMLHYFTQEASVLFEGKEHELQMAKLQHEADVAQLKRVLVAAKDQHDADVVQLKQKHAADLALLKNEVQKANDKASGYAEELQKAQADHVAMVRDITSMHHRQRIGLQQENSRLLSEFYNKGVRDTKELVLTLFGDSGLDLSEFTNTNLHYDSTPPPGLAPQPPQDDQN